MSHCKDASSGTLTRRSLLSAVSAISVLSLSNWPGRALAANLTTESFFALSQGLVEKKELSEVIAGEMLKAFRAIGHEDDLASLAEGKSDYDLANSVVLSWYTGESPDPDDLQVLTYTDALIWEAMDYTKPMAFCGGGVGYWADPPEA